MKSFFLKITLIFVLLISYGCSYQSALAPIEKDPYEEMNRSIYEFNENLDKTVLEPVADSYDFVMLELFQTGVQNFFNNANYPVTIVNQALQGKFSASFESLFRFTINTTIGIGGLFDPAKSLGYESKSEDFGQTLGVWGFDSGSYLMTPLFGPYTVRHAFGDVFDNLLSPINYIDDTATKYAIRIIDKVQERSDLSALEEELYGSYDPYQYIRDSYIQNRDYKVTDGAIDEELEDELFDLEDF